MRFRFASPEEEKVWNSHVLANPDGGNVFQSHELAEQKKHSHWVPRFVISDSLAITLLEKKFLGKKLWYIPKGPGVSSPRELSRLLSPLKDFARKHNVFVIKIEPELKKTDETLADLIKLGLRKVRPVQPSFSTILLDLSPSLEKIMASLNQKGRHAIHRAERDGVTVQQVTSTDKNCHAMYKLLAETAAGSFPIRSYNYYKSFWQRYEKAGYGQLFFAYVNNEVVAGAYAITFGKKSTYKDGASVRERTVYGASHLLQWRVIEWAKNKGALHHDFGGSPSSDEIKNPQHRWYGIGRFKTSFNKEVTDYIGTYDVIIRPKIYAFWSSWGERIALRWHRFRYKEDYY